MERYSDIKLYFSANGIGLGHVSRCLPIAKKLLQNGTEIMFSTYLEGFDYIKQHGLPVAYAPELSLANDETGSIDLKASIITQGISAAPTFLNQVNTEIKYMKSFKPDIVVSDSRLSSIWAAKLLEIPVVCILNQFLPILPREEHNLTLFKLADWIILGLISMGWGSSDAIIIPDFPEPYTISLDSLRIPSQFKEKVSFVGAILPLIPDKIGKINIREKLKIRKNQKLIYIGISGPRAERLPLIRQLEPIFSNFPEDYRVIMSMGDPLGGSTPIHHGNLTIIPWITDRFQYLKTCDLIISRAGHETIIQNICYKKPSILIPVPKHTEQYANARRAKELGVADALHQKDVNKERLLKVIRQMETGTEYVKTLKNLNREQILEKGVDNSIQVITNILFKNYNK